MEILTIFEHWEAVTAVLSGLVTVALLWLSSHFVRRAEFGDMQREAQRMQNGQEERLTTLDSSLALFRQQLELMPKAGDMSEIKVALAHLSGRIDVLQEQVHGQAEVLKIVKHQSDLINLYLREKKND
jgi:hypothetical protein